MFQKPLFAEGLFRNGHKTAAEKFYTWKLYSRSVSRRSGRPTELQNQPAFRRLGGPLFRASTVYNGFDAFLLQDHTVTLGQQ